MEVQSIGLAERMGFDPKIIRLKPHLIRIFKIRSDRFSSTSSNIIEIFIRRLFQHHHHHRSAHGRTFYSLTQKVWGENADNTYPRPEVAIII